MYRAQIPFLNKYHTVDKVSCFS